jgi:hypothetical protein
MFTGIVAASVAPVVVGSAAVGGFTGKLIKKYKNLNSIKKVIDAILEKICFYCSM